MIALDGAGAEISFFSFLLFFFFLPSHIFASLVRRPRFLQRRRNERIGRDRQQREKVLIRPQLSKCIRYICIWLSGRRKSFSFSLFHFLFYFATFSLGKKKETTTTVPFHAPIRPAISTLSSPCQRDPCDLNKSLSVLDLDENIRDFSNWNRPVHDTES